MLRSSSLLLAALLSAKTTTSEPVCYAEDQPCIESHTSLPCGVYMAPSTIGVANMGIYTAIPLEKGAVVNYPEIAIPILFRDWGWHGDNPDGTLWDRYIWDHGVAHVEPKQSDLKREDKGAVFIPGVGCTINSRLDMHNIHSTHGSTYDTAGLYRLSDQGSGAFSPYHSSQTTARRAVAAGEELFAAYGDNWIPDIPGAVITFNDNMDQTDDFLEDYKEWMDASGITAEVKEGLWNLTKEFPMPSAVLAALPQAEWNDVSRHLSGQAKSTSRHFIDEIGHNSIEWLQEHGKCQDHLKPGRSTIAQAGRGAFAARNLPKGSVVAYSPLVHIGDAREILTINYTSASPDPYTVEDLVINYSYGHPNSTIILTPYGAMVNYINHHQERANVKLAWPAKELVAHKPEWLHKDIEFLRNIHEKIGLSFDYIALRDIEEGEEIFIDYGDWWQEAWDIHVREWKPVPNADKYVHSTEWKEESLRTLEELSSKPYPPNLHTLCHESYKQEGNRFVHVPVMRNKNRRRYCDVLERTERTIGGRVKYSYKVKLHLKTGKSVIIDDVPPKKGVELVDKIKSADWHMPNSFRHPMQLPNDIIPKSWLNKLQE